MPKSISSTSTNLGKYSSNISYESLPALNRKTRLFYSFGHIYNDLCASIWFSYTLLYFKINFDDSTAGMLLLLGQVADAISTPLIGYGSDQNFNYFICRYGRRKIWHLIGTICVTLSFPFIFNACFVCDESGFWIKFSYYASFIIVFQFGWACVQISHVALLVDLVSTSAQRVELNAYRQAATVGSSICVYSITLMLLGVEETTISKKDTIVFMKVVHLISVIGIVFSILFHIFVREGSYEETLQLRQALGNDDYEERQSVVFRERAGSCYSVNISEFGSNKNINKTDKNSLGNVIYKKRVSLLEPDIKIDDKVNKIKRNRKQKIWSDWFNSKKFWQMCLIYMMARLFVNLTQVYTPLYLQESLGLAKRNIAIVPFITYFTGFIFSLIAKPMSKRVGSKSILSIGCAFGLFSCIWILFGGLNISLWQVFIVAAIFGIGGTAMLIGSLALTADLIGDNIVSGAFVFGAMSFFDKLVNGGVIAIIQHFNPLSPMNLTNSINQIEGNESDIISIINNTLELNTSDASNLSSNSLYTTISPIHLSNLTDSETISELIPVLYYLQVLVYVCGAAVIMTFMALLTILKSKFAKQNSNH